MRQSRGILLIGIVLGLLTASATVEPATRELVNTDSPQTLSNKTLVSPVLQGNVGIGTTSPNRTLTVSGDIGADNIYLVNTGGVFGPNTTEGIGVFSVSHYMDVFTNSVERIRINGNGNVGIGTMSPTYNLHVAGRGLFTYAGPYALGVGNNTTGDPSYWLGGASNGVDLVFSSSGAQERMRLTDGGNIGIGTTSPSSRLDVSGGCITGSMCSDARLKEDIRPLPQEVSYLEKVLRLRGVSFQWKGRPERGRQIGLVAQEVERVLPEAVTTPEGGTAQKGLSCTALDAALVEALKEQQAQIQEQQTQLRALQQELAALKRGGV